MVGVNMWFQANPMFCPACVKLPPVLPAPPIAGTGRLGEAGMCRVSWLYRKKMLSSPENT